MNEINEMKEVAMFAASILYNKKARDILVIDIQEKAGFADYFILATGTSERQIKTLSEEVEDQFAKNDMIVKRIEGKQSSGWILMDFGDVIVNILTDEMRDKYKIEKVWNDCEFIEYGEES